MVIDLARVDQATVKRAPYPYFVSTDVLRPDEASAVASSFPAIDRPGAIAVDDTSYGAAFQTLLDDLRSDAFRNIIADKLLVDLDGKEIVINVRGQSRWTDGNIHTDSPSKLVTVLLYFNEPGEATDATALRILKNGRNIEDFVEEVPPVLGSLLAFKVTPDCWHGFKPYSGPRHSLQLNYLSGFKTRHKHEGARRFVRHSQRRVEGVVHTAERDAGALWLATWEKRTPWYVKLIAGITSLLALSPLDLTPDVIPVIGYLDDVILLTLGTLLVARLVPAPLMAELRRRAASIDRTNARRGAVAILCIWLAATGTAVARASGAL